MPRVFLPPTISATSWKRGTTAEAGRIQMVRCVRPVLVRESAGARFLSCRAHRFEHARRYHLRAEGLDLLLEIVALDSFFAGHRDDGVGPVELAVEAMRRGARDFIQKPWDNATALAILKRRSSCGRALRKGQRLEAENRAASRRAVPAIDRRTPAMRPVLDVISRVGPIGRERLDHRRKRHRQGSRCADAPLASRYDRRVRWSPSTPADWPRAFSKANFSAMSKARSPMRKAIVSGVSKWRTAAPSFSTKSRIFRFGSRLSCCVCWRRPLLSVWVRRVPAA